MECFDCVSQLFSYLADKRKLGLARTDDVAVIVNNLGGTFYSCLGCIAFQEGFRGRAPKEGAEPLRRGQHP